MTPFRPEIPEDVAAVAPPRWRYFRVREIKEAFAHADAGGIAVHDSGMKYKRNYACHLFAESKMALMNAAEELGLDTKWVQIGYGRDHFDIFGEPLMRALQKCMEEEDR